MKICHTFEGNARYMQLSIVLLEKKSNLSANLLENPRLIKHIKMEGAIPNIKYGMLTYMAGLQPIPSTAAF